MKKILIVALALASANAFASRARETALGNSAHLVDTQTVYSNPADILVLADYVNFESGTTAAATTSDYAEGMITRSIGESKFGLGIGHRSADVIFYRGLAAGAPVTGIKGQQNPIYLTYGLKMDDMLIGVGLVYSSYNDKAAELKESTAGLRLGLRTGAWDAKLGIGLMNTFENAVTDEKFTGTGGISAGVGYAMDDMYYNLAVSTSGYKAENATTETAKQDDMNVKLGALQSLKQDGNELFWGVALAYGTSKVGTAATTTTTTMSLPVTLGVEADAASWLTLRGSVTQNVILQSKKDDASPNPTVDEAPGLNSTAVAAGVGLKFNKLTVDATLSDFAGTQKVDGNNLLALVGVTYLY